jgi:hypothetical protein
VDLHRLGEALGAVLRDQESVARRTVMSKLQRITEALRGLAEPGRPRAGRGDFPRRGGRIRADP